MAQSIDKASAVDIAVKTVLFVLQRLLDRLLWDRISSLSKPPLPDRPTVRGAHRWEHIAYLLPLNNRILALSLHLRRLELGLFTLSAEFSADSVRQKSNYKNAMNTGIRGAGETT